MVLNKLDKNRYKEWNNFVNNSKQGSIFSKTWYLDALQVPYEILAIEDKGKIKAGIILAKNEINTFSNPMLDKYLGVLFLNEDGNHQKIISKQYKYMELIISQLKQIKSFDYYFHPSFQNWIPFSWGGFTQQTRYTYRINNQKSLDEIYASFHGNLKNDIKNAQKEQVTIKQNISFDELWKQVNKTFIRQGSKSPFKKEKLRHFILELRKREVFVSFGAYNSSGECIAVCGLVHEEKSSYLLLNGIDIENQVRGANAYMIYESIKFFHSKCSYYDFEGSMLPGVEQFYRRFGGELTPYMCIWNDNFFNYAKAKAKKIYKKIRYGR
jgi:hypothetical protein